MLLLVLACRREKNETSARQIDSLVQNEVEVESAEQSDEILKEEFFGSWKGGVQADPQTIEKVGVDNCFVAEEIDDSLFERMNDNSYKQGAPVNRADLRYLKILYHDFTGGISKGEIVCNKKIASDLLEIFRKLYDEDYLLESVRLIDEYGGDDLLSMQANNTSCFNYRPTTGGSKLSKHAYGMAIDINPLYNPYVKLKTGKILPSGGEAYTDREKDFPYKINNKYIAYKEFAKRGYKWGGSWRTVKDYQHFEK